MTKRQHNILLIILLVIAIPLGIFWQFYPIGDAQERMNKLPISGPDFEGHNIPLTPLEKEYLPRVNILKRVYTVGEKKYFIYILDGTHNRHAVHDPTYCLAGAGWTSVGKKDVSIKKGTAAIYTLRKDEQVRDVLIWFSNGKEAFASPMRYWLDTTLRRLTLGKLVEEPVLVVIQPLDPKDTDWNQFLEYFPQITEI